jgi:hypothetical protein
MFLLSTRLEPLGGRGLKPLGVISGDIKGRGDKGNTKLREKLTHSDGLPIPYPTKTN